MPEDKLISYLKFMKESWEKELSKGKNAGDYRYAQGNWAAYTNAILWAEKLLEEKKNKTPTSITSGAK